MTVEYSQDGATVENNDTVSGAPAILISGDDVHFTNTEEGRLTGSTAGMPVVSVTGLRATIINAEGGVLTHSSADQTAIVGSAGGDVVVNYGLLRGKVLLGDGADSFTQGVNTPNNGAIDLGAGDDTFRHEYAAGISGSYTYVNTVAGGAGYDRLVVAGYSLILEGSGATGFEALDLAVMGDNNWNLINFSGFSAITLTAGGDYNFISSANPLADLAMAGGWVSSGPGSVFRDITGSDASEVVEVNSGTIRNASLGGGDDHFWYSIFQSPGLNLPAGVVQGVVDGGAGYDRINLSVGGGITIDMAMTTGFEAINTGTFSSATSDVRLLNLDGFTLIEGDTEGRLVIGESSSPNAMVGISFPSTLILESTTTVLHVGYDVTSWGVPLTVPDPERSLSVTNDGTVLGDVRLYIGDDLFDGRLGSVGGSIYGFAGNDHLRGGATTDRMWGGTGADRLEGHDGDDFLHGESGGDRLDGGAGDDLLDGAAGNDTLTSGTGIDQLSGGDGNDVFLLGAALTAADGVDGGAGRDQLAIQGNYAMTLTSAIVGLESIAILPGSDTRFGDPGTNSYDYDLTTVDANVAAGVQMIVDASGLRAGEDLRFNGSAETDGSFFIYGGRGVDTLTGGAGNDAFYFGEGLQFGAGDVIDGGPGGIDQLGLRGSYTVVFGSGQLNGIDSIGLVSAQDTRFGPQGASYNYNLTMDNGNVAFGAQLTLDAFALRAGETLSFNGAAETDGTYRIFGGQGHDNIVTGQGNDTLAGNRGADNLTGGGGADTFRFNASADSAPGAADHIHDFAPGVDKIDLTRIDADTHVEGDQAFHWVDAFTGSGAGSAGELRAYLDNGNWFIEGDTDGNGVADLRITMTAPAMPIGQSDFLL